MAEHMKRAIEAVRESFRNGGRARTHEPGACLGEMVPMRDGVQLRTRIRMPAGDGPWPLLFTRTPYAGMDALNEAIAEEYAARGIAFLWQFCRGTGGSEGVWAPNVHERDDGFDTLEWTLAQPWCGDVGIHGVSYMSLAGWILADRLPERVKGLFLCHYGIDRHLSAYRDGMFRHDILTGWALGNTGRRVEGDFRESYLAACRHRPHVDADEAVWGVRLDWYRDWITQTDYDAPYWQTGFWALLRGIAPQVRVPVCVVAGWFDHHLEGTLLGYERLGPEAKAHSRLIAGAWNHDFEPCIPGHPHENARMDMHGEMFEWFHGLLVRGEKPTPGVERYVVGEDRWLKGGEWPAKASRTRSFALSARPSGMPGARGMDEMSRLQPPGAAANCAEPSDSAPCADREAAGTALPDTVIRWRHDPDNPVPTRGGETVFVTGAERGSRRQDPPGARDDVVTFLSEPLEEPLAACGAIEVHLDVASDCADTCFTAKLSETFPDGTSWNIRSGITTLAYRNGTPHRLTYELNERVRIVLRMLPVDWTLAKGSRLRVDLASSNFPEYSVHPNVPGIWSQQCETRIAEQTLHVGAGSFSRVVLPIRMDDVEPAETALL